MQITWDSGKKFGYKCGLKCRQLKGHCFTTRTELATAVNQLIFWLPASKRKNRTELRMLQTLVTGANSFVAAHIINELISKGHTVVGSLRHASSGDAILTTHPEWKNGLSFVEVEDYAAERAWDDVFKKHNIDYVIHVAAPLLDDPKNTDYDRDYIKPSVDGYDPAATSFRGADLTISKQYLATPFGQAVFEEPQSHSRHR